MFLSIKNVPKVSWSSDKPFNLKPKISTSFFLCFGLILFGLGEAPAAETINNPSPNPNRIKPKHKKKDVEIFGFKLKGLSELHETLGTFFIDKNMT